ncbi:transglycosylase domain-containing protein [Bacillus sp. SCS-151]|uniref:transglycosylase domain-containing protein n=1 Tax=Nanhaiella sioensis TaxID=3115293 RepID=UPI003977F882
MLKVIGKASVIIFFTFFVGLVAYLFIIYAGDYVVDEKKLVMNSASTLVSDEDELIAKLFIENRELVSIQDIPKHVQQAFISVEDERFYNHHGVDLRAIMRALYRDITEGKKVEGGSTITQQLAKNIFLSNEKTWLRKTKEVIIALNLEKKYSKQELLEMYLNQIYFGHGAYGIEAASQLYFNKHVSELTVEQGALLAAIPKAPTNYSPILQPEKSFDRRNLVLSLMERKGYITPEDAVRYQGRTLALDINQMNENMYLLSYIDLVVKEAEERYGLTNNELLKGGYKITVPLDATVQQKAYEFFQDSNNFAGTDENVEGAFVLMDNKTGGIIACIGGRNYVQKGLNRAIVKRQPGSTFKPIVVYGPALEKEEFDPYSLLVDQLLQYGDYKPHNYNDVYKDKITMYDAIIESANAPAVWALNNLGIDYGKEYLEKAGIPIKDKGLAMALGGLEEGVSPIDLTKVYRAFAEGGKVIEPHFITKIEDRNNRVIGKFNKEEKRVFSKQTAWYMTRMLEGVVREGTAQMGKYSGALAGKTGSTSYEPVEDATKDAWFVGYTPTVVGALWMGYDKTDKSHYLTKGSSQPTLLFKKIIEETSESKHLAFQIPEQVKDLEQPIRLKEINDLFAQLSFKPYGFFSVNLEWTPAEDKRIKYRIYEKKNNKATLIGTVTGKGNFAISSVNIFSIPNYQVVPYNPITGEEGSPSNNVKPQFFTFDE